jgi:hypothetical protein
MKKRVTPSHPLFLSFSTQVLQFFSRYITLSEWCTLCCVNRAYRKLVETKVPWESICNAPPYAQVLPAARRLNYTRANLFFTLKNEVARNWCAGCLTRDEDCYPMHWLHGTMLPMCIRRTCGYPRRKPGTTLVKNKQVMTYFVDNHELIFGECSDFPYLPPRSFLETYLESEIYAFNTAVVEYIRSKVGAQYSVNVYDFLTFCHGLYASRVADLINVFKKMVPVQQQQQKGTKRKVEEEEEDEIILYD